MLTFTYFTIAFYVVLENVVAVACGSLR